MKPQCALALAASAAMLLAAGSCSGRPERISMTDLDPSAAARRAIDQYDTDGDGTLAEEEFSKSPAFVKARQQFDADADGSMTEDEIAARLQSWMDSNVALHVLPVRVIIGGRPLAGATVTFLPEEFLGDEFRPADGVTNNNGTANIMHAPPDRPDPEFPQGVRTGLYRVQVSKVQNGKELIPAKYNEDTQLGQELASGAAGMGQVVTFNLSP